MEEKEGCKWIKGRVLPCRFGAPSPQAIGVTPKLP